MSAAELASPPPLDTSRHALLLDFDGTFVDFAPTPEAVCVRPGGIDLLQGLVARLGGAFAIISGRRIEDLDGFLAPLKPNAVGVHGQEFRQLPGEIVARPVTPDLAEARRRLRASIASDDPLLLEDKGAALVVHYRQYPEQKGRAEDIAAGAVAGLADLHAVPGHAIVEIRQRGVGKGDAVRLVGSWPPFEGRLPVFLGDDTTDEDGFRAAAAAGGFGVKVGAGETAAAYRLPDVAAVHAWLGEVR